MNTLKRCATIILIIVLSVSLCACAGQGKDNEIETLTKNFEKACNKLDLNGMLDCVDPEISKSVKAITELVGLFSDKDTDELLDGLAKVLFRELPENSKELFSSIKIKLDDNIEISEDIANASAEIVYEISGEEHTSNVSLEYVKLDEKWYISDVSAQ